jgi:hypothetical protein
MKASMFFCVLGVVGVSAAGPGLAAADVGWMQPGVRLWYLGAVEGAGVTSSNAEEAYLLDAVVGTNARVVSHSALTHWTSPRPVDSGTYSLLDQGPCWMHPQRLQTVAIGDFWRDVDQKITWVDRTDHTYSTFVNNVLPAKVHLLPIKALFDLKPTRQIVKLVYMIDQFSVGSAYFDAETGIVLYHNQVWGVNKMFFVLAEINYDFARQAPFAEDAGPHTGFKSLVVEASLGRNWVGGGSVVFQSLVESRYGTSVEMRVLWSWTASIGGGTGDENYCFFGDVPLVTRMDATQAPNYPPDQWNPFGQYLWWWLPPAATFQPTAAGDGQAGVPSINVFNVPMAKASDAPLTYVATETPAAFHFSRLWFDSDGYMTAFSAKGPGGLDLKPGDDAFENHTTVDGRDYYRTAMASRASDFNGDGQSDIVWRNTATGQNVVWLMDAAGLLSQASLPPVADARWQLAAVVDLNADRKPDLVWRNVATGQNAVWYLDGTALVSQAALPSVTDLNWQIVATADFNGDGKPDLVWRNQVTGQNVVWYLDGATLVSQALLAPVVDTAWQIAGSGDFNGDLKPDLLWRNAVTGQNVVWYLNGATLVSQAALPPVADTRWRVGLVVDFNRDGRVDVVWRNSATGQNVVWCLSGVTVVGQVALPGVSDSQWDMAGQRTLSPATPGDFNGDGQADLVWRNAATGQNVVWYMDGASFASQATIPTVADTDWQMVATADLNGDRQSDIVWRNATTGLNVVWCLSGVTVLSQASLPTVADPDWRIVAAADLNEDGKPDLVWRNATTGQNVVWYLNGTTFLSQAFLPPVTDPNWRVAAAADFNGDKKPDLVWRNDSTGQNVVWYLSGATFLSQGLLPGVTDPDWQIAQAGDFSGDGKPDLVWRNHVTGQNVVWRLDGVALLGQSVLPSVPGPNWMILGDRR